MSGEQFFKAKSQRVSNNEYLKTEGVISFGLIVNM